MRKLEGSFVVEAPPGQVTTFCSDLRNVIPAMPRVVEVKEAAPGNATVVVDAGVSFIKGRFTVRIERTEGTENSLRYSGHGDGPGNAVDFDSRLEVANAENEGTSIVTWSSEVRVHGPLASMGAGLINPIINQNIERFVANLKETLEGRSVEQPPTRPSLWRRLISFLSRFLPGGSGSSSSDHRESRSQ